MEDNRDGAATDSRAASPPYIAFRTLLNLVERMEREGIPGRVDKSYLDNLAGGYQGQVFSALRSLGLMGEDHRVLPPLQDLVAQPARREELVGELVRRTYPWALSLGEDATHGQLDDAFRENAPSLGAHARQKAVTFYMHAAKFAGLSLSKHYKGAASVNGTAPGPRRRAATRRPRNAATPPPTTQQPRSSDEDRKHAYFDLLLGLAKEGKVEDGTPADILDRIERLLGLEPKPAPQPSEEVPS